MAEQNRPPIILNPIQGPFGPNFSGGTPLSFTPFGQKNPNIAAIPPAQPGPINQQATAAQAAIPNQSTSLQGSGFTAVAAPPTAPANIPGPTSFIGQIPFFLNAVLSTPAGALPKGPLWVIVFDFDDKIRNTIKKVKDYEPRMPEPWEIDNALETVTSHRYQDEKGCMFAQTVTLPGEGVVNNPEGLQYNGFIRGRVGGGRNDFNSIRIGFLNTNVSFVDNVVRPWVVMTGHLGMIARPPEQKYRCNMSLYKLGIVSVDQPPFIAQQFDFWEVCPINVSEENLDYSGDGRTPIKEAEFVFQWYTTRSNKNSFAVPLGKDTRGVTAGPEIRRAFPVGTVPQATPVQ